jgi:hypothetical protein
LSSSASSSSCVLDMRARTAERRRVPDPSKSREPRLRHEGFAQRTIEKSTIVLYS